MDCGDDGLYLKYAIQGNKKVQVFLARFVLLFVKNKSILSIKYKVFSLIKS